MVAEFLSLSCPSHVLLRSLFSLGTDALTTDDMEGAAQRRQEAVWAPPAAPRQLGHCAVNTEACVPPSTHRRGAQGTEQARVSSASVTMQWTC